MTEQQLYLKAINLNPNDSEAYSNLGTTLATGASIQLLNGTSVTKQQLCAKVDWQSYLKKRKAETPLRTSLFA